MAFPGRCPRGRLENERRWPEPSKNYYMLGKPRLPGGMVACGARRRHCFKALLFGCGRLALGSAPTRHCRAAGLGGRSPSSGRLALGSVPTRHCRAAGLGGRSPSTARRPGGHRAGTGTRDMALERPRSYPPRPAMSAAARAGHEEFESPCAEMAVDGPSPPNLEKRMVPLCCCVVSFVWGRF